MTYSLFVDIWDGYGYFHLLIDCYYRDAINMLLKCKLYPSRDVCLLIFFNLKRCLVYNECSINACYCWAGKKRTKNIVHDVYGACARGFLFEILLTYPSIEFWKPVSLYTFLVFAADRYSLQFPFLFQAFLSLWINPNSR